MAGGKTIRADSEMKRILVAIAALMLIVPTASMAATNKVFSALEGKFRGKGTAIVGSSGKKVRISCQLTNSYNEKTGKLKMNGKCASTQGKRKINGAIAHKGNSVSGSYFSVRSGVKMTKSSGKTNGSNMTIFASFFDEQIGSLIKIKQVIKVSGGGFNANLLTYDNKTKKYKSAGKISFKRKGK